MLGQRFHGHGWINEKREIHSKLAWWGNKHCKREIEILYRNIKCVKNDLLDPLYNFSMLEM